MSFSWLRELLVYWWETAYFYGEHTCSYCFISEIQTSINLEAKLLTFFHKLLLVINKVGFILINRAQLFKTNDVVS